MCVHNALTFLPIPGAAVQFAQFACVHDVSLDLYKFRKRASSRFLLRSMGINLSLPRSDHGNQVGVVVVPLCPVCPHIRDS